MSRLTIVCLCILCSWGYTADASANDESKGCQIDTILDHIQGLNYEQRRSAYADLLRRVSQIEDTEDDYVAQYFFERGGAIAVAMRDGAYLEALDDQRLDGGFANMVCMSYKEALRHDFARAAYAAKPGRRKYLLRCFESGDLDKRILGSMPMTEPRRVVPEFRSCDIDRVLLSSRPKASDVQRFLAQMSRLDPQRSWHLIAYLAFRLRDNASGRSGQLIWREVAKLLSDSRPPPSICQLMMRAEIEEPVCRLLRRQRRVPQSCLDLAGDVEAETAMRLKSCAAGKPKR